MITVLKPEATKSDADKILNQIAFEQSAQLTQALRPFVQAAGRTL